MLKYYGLSLLSFGELFLSMSPVNRKKSSVFSTNRERKPNPLLPRVFTRYARDVSLCLKLHPGDLNCYPATKTTQLLTLLHRSSHF